MQTTIIIVVTISMSLLVLWRINIMDQKTQDALADVSAKEDRLIAASQRASTLLNGLTAAIAELKSNQTDPAIVDALTALGLKADEAAQALDATVVADTPQA